MTQTKLREKRKQNNRHFRHGFEYYFCKACNRATMKINVMTLGSMVYVGGERTCNSSTPMNEC